MLTLVSKMWLFKFSRPMFGGKFKIGQKTYIFCIKKEGILNIQSNLKLKCCGITSPNDWDKNPYFSCKSVSTMACSVPPSCCYNFTTVC